MTGPRVQQFALLDNGEHVWTGTLAALVADNEGMDGDDEADIAAALRDVADVLRPGNAVCLGGGASGTFTLCPLGAA